VRSGLLAIVLVGAAVARGGADESVPNPPTAGSKKPRVSIVGDHLELSEPIYFETGKATIKPSSFDVLDAVVATLKASPQLELLEVQVHSDERGADDYNLQMSDRRAFAVRSYLVTHGVAAERLQARGYGETKPLCSEHNERCWSRNRRTEIVILRGR
jgi:outer membrane protein OmpA-like peptidoglycan-associated protein